MCIRSTVVPESLGLYRTSPTIVKQPTVFSTRAVSVMPDKRKLAEVESPVHHPPAHSRRRSRRIVDKDLTNDHDAALEGIFYGSNGTRGSSKEPWEARGNVERAMRHLQDMENELQRVVKRQQLAVETSDLSGELDEATTDSITRVQPPGGLPNEAHDKYPDSVEQAPLDRYEAELADGDIASAAKEDDDIDRSARRAPPVNSETLPLPWLGRLGYVRSSSPK